MEYSIYDALRAGFNKVVFIIKPEMEEMVRQLCGDTVARRTALDGRPVEVAYAFQDFSSVPSFYHIPAERTKPFWNGFTPCCARRMWCMSPAASSMPMTITALMRTGRSTRS